MMGGVADLSNVERVTSESEERSGVERSLRGCVAGEAELNCEATKEVFSMTK